MKNSGSDCITGLGDWLSHSTTPTGLEIKTTADPIFVTVYHPGIIRVRVSANQKRDFSYAVIVSPEKIPFTVSETPAGIELLTGTVKLVISKKKISFAFYDLNNNLLNCDDPLVASRIGNQITAYKKLQEGERFIGLGEKTGNLDRKGSAYTMWNTDFFSYGVEADPIYMSIPFYIGVHHETAYGIFFDNTYKGKFNFGASNTRFASFSAEGGDLNYYFIYGNNIRQIIENYTWLTGRMELPPMWSLGFQQCRYSYYPDKKVLNIARSFREKNIPADCIYLDIHYMDKFKVFSFDKERFPEPEKMTAELAKLGFETVVILDPGIKVEPGYAPYDEGMKNNYFAELPDGEPYTGAVWPGWSHFPDFTMDKVREWWGEHLKFYTDKGINGFWNDMNEPAVWGQSVPDIVQFEYDGEGANSLKAHNVYGMQMCRSTHDGYKTNVPDRRPFVLNRAGYSGVQRYGATWTGDNVATDEHMLCGVRLVNALGLSGVPFSGYDIAGFAGEPTPELFARWISMGAFSPLYRCHSMINTKDSEPWAFGEEVEEISRNYISLRYRLLPYIYSTFYQSVQTGLPVARSLAIDYTHDEHIYSETFQNQYLFGDAFLIAPVASIRRLVPVYLPKGVWYDMHTGIPSHMSGSIIAPSPEERLPVFVRGSSIIPMQSLVQSTKEKPSGILEVHIYRGETENSFCYYEDDASSYQYQQGQYYKRLITYSPEKNQISFGAVEGKYPSHFRQLKIYLHKFEPAGNYSTRGKTLNVSQENYHFVPPVSSFDPFYTEQATDMIDSGIPVIQVENTSDEIVIKW